MTKRFSVYFFLVACVLLIPVILFGIGQNEAQAKEPVKIGVIQPLTGNVAFDGQTSVEGAKLAAEQINAKGGVLDGRMIELVIEDGACVPAQSVSAAEKLITRDGVSVLAGCFCSSSTGAVMPIAKANGIPLVTGISTSPTLTEQGNEYFFRAVGTSALFAKAFAKSLKEELNINRIAYLAVNDDWGRGSSKSFGEAFEALGGQNVALEIFGRDDTDYYSYLTKIKTADPEGIYVVANTANAARITNQVKELGIEAKIFGEGAWTSDTYLDLTKENSEGVYGVIEYLSTVDTELNKEFVKAYQAAYDGKNPSKYSASVYQVISIIAEAIERAGADDPEAIRAALEKTEYHGLNGTMVFSEGKHQAYGHNMYMARIENGKPVLAVSSRLGKPE